MTTSKTPRFIGPIWEGVFSNFADVPSAGDGFMTSDWIENSRRRLEAIKTTGCRYQEYLLPAVAATIAAERGRDPLIILDVGGGAGNGYPPLRAAMPSGSIEFNVVENEQVCKLGRDAFPKISELKFHTTIPNLPRIDIIHLGSVIQYVDDWKSFIKQLTGLQPDYLLFSDAFTGSVPTFVTAQHFYGLRLPCRFLSLDELKTFVENQCMKLVLDTEYDRTMLGKRDPLPMEALPEQYRLRYTHHLLFRRTTACEKLPQ